MNAALKPRNDTVFSTIGRLLDLKIGSEADLLRLAQDGLSPRAYKRAATKLNLPVGLIGPATTVKRRLDGNERLSQTETERLLRVARIYSEATQLFGSDDAAMAWMTSPAEFVQGQPPIKPVELAASDSGARLLESHIQRTAYGMF